MELAEGLVVALLAVVVVVAASCMLPGAAMDERSVASALETR